MSKLDTYKVDLLSPQLQGSKFMWHVDDDFFAEIEGLIRRGSLDVKAECVSVGATIKFLISSVGSVIVPCDRCLADLELRIETSDELNVQLGAEHDDTGDCVIVPEAEGYINLAQYIYEFIALSMPITSTHEPGKCDETMMRTLSTYQSARSGDEDVEDFEQQPADNNPFAKLKDLKF